MHVPGMTPIDEELRSYPAVDRVFHLGYRIAYQFRPDGRFLDFHVRNQGRPAGHACFEIRSENREIAAEQINVFDGHRRKGVANALYVLAKCLTGFEFVPAANQTDDARALWAQTNRPW